MGRKGEKRNRQHKDSKDRYKKRKETSMRVTFHSSGSQIRVNEIYTVGVQVSWGKKVGRIERAANAHWPPPSALTLTNRPSQSTVYSSYRPDGRRAVTSPPPSRCTYSIPARGGGGTKRRLPPPSHSVTAGAVATDEDEDDEDDDGVWVASDTKRGRIGVDGEAD